MQQYIIKRSDGKYFYAQKWIYIDNIEYATVLKPQMNLKRFLEILKDIDNSYDYKLCKVKVSIKEINL